LGFSDCLADLGRNSIAHTRALDFVVLPVQEYAKG
jgi:hypothetical protein